MARTKASLPLLSASRLKLYLECPKMYKYKYLQKGEERPNIYAIHGSALHKAIELQYKEKAVPYTIYTDRMLKYGTRDVLGFDQYARLYKEGIEILETFDTAWYIPRIEKKKPALERWFNLPYPNAEKPICMIRGYMDLIQLDSVVDFKSSKLKLSKKKVENDLQFIIYYWAFNQLYGYYPDRIIYHRLPDHKQIVGTEFDTVYLDMQIQKFLADPMEYEPIACEKCPIWCGVRNAIT